MHQLPRSREELDDTRFPIAISLQPLASARDPKEAAMPLVDLSAGPPRCARCHAYVNKFVEKWRRVPRSRGVEATVWTCPLCRSETELPEWYVLDRGRPELSSASVDIAVSADYTVRSVQKPVVVFTMDATYSAADMHVLVDLVQSVCRKASAQCRFGLVLFSGSGSIYFVTVAVKKRILATDEPLIDLVSVPDINDPFCPLAPDAWLFEPAAAIALVAATVRVADALRTTAQDQDNACVAALAAAADGLNEVGGKICLITSAGPTRGLGAAFLSARLPSKTKTKTPSQPCTYEELALRLARQQVSVDVLCVDSSEEFSASKFDGSAAALGRLTVATGGRLCYHTSVGDGALSKNMQLATTWLDRRQCASGVEATIGSAHECVLKVRCSRGLRVARYYGAGIGGDAIDEDVNAAAVLGATRDLVACDPTLTVFCDLEHDSPKLEGDVAFVQAAFLYSDALNKRRVVRVHTLALAVAPRLSNIYRFADLETVFAVLVKRALLSVLHDDSSLADIANAATPVRSRKPSQKINRRPEAHSKWTTARDSLVDTCVAILKHYRSACAPRSPSGQLILPESVKLLPLLCLGALKGPLLREDANQAVLRAATPPMVPSGPGGLGLRANTTTTASRVNAGFERAALISRALAAPVDEITRLAYPRLYEWPSWSDNERITVVPTTAESLNADRAYLLDAGHALFIYIGADVDDARRDDLLAPFFDADSPTCFVAKDFPEFDGDNDLSNGRHIDAAPRAHRIRQLVGLLVQFRSTCPPLRLVLGSHETTDDDPPCNPTASSRSLEEFLAYLVEDKTSFGASYVDFLCSVHREIQCRLHSKY